MIRPPQYHQSGVDHPMIGLARNEPQDYPERTGIPVRTERHCAGLEGVL
jgi:hypothetical protein